MSSELDNRTLDRAWAYVHQALDPAGRQALEAELAADPRLRAEVALIRQLHRGLSDAGAVWNKDETRLIEEALSAWEAEQGLEPTAPVAIPGVAPATVLRFPGRRALGAQPLFSSPARRLVLGLAAAAVVVIAVLPLCPEPAPRWAPPSYAAPAFRGAGSQERLGEVAAMRCQAALRRAFLAARAAEPVRLPRGVTIRMQVQEIAGGQFTVGVRAEGRHGQVLGEWTGDYSSEAAFVHQAPASARAILEALTEGGESGP